MSFPTIENARTFRELPRCQHSEPDGQRCEARADVWLVGPRGNAILHECLAHANAALAEYAAHPEIEMLQGWTTHPITIEARS